MYQQAAISGDEIIDRFFFEKWQAEIREGINNHFGDNDKLDEQVLIANTFNEFIMSLANWKSFITLTFREPVGVDVARAKVLSLIALLNRRLFGKHYSKCVLHSYFSYCIGMEYQERDVIHFHMLVDRSVDFVLIHKWWDSVAGFAYIEKIHQRELVVSYVTKYVLKGGNVWLYKSKSDLMPRKKPIWFTS